MMLNWFPTYPASLLAPMLSASRFPLGPLGMTKANQRKLRKRRRIARAHRRSGRRRGV